MLPATSQEHLFMTFLMVTLFAFAIGIMLTGFYFTTKSYLRNQRAEYPVARRRVVESIPLQRQRPVDSVPVARRRTIVESAPVRSYRLRGGTYYRPSRAISVSTLWERINRRQTGEPIPWSVIIIGLLSIILLGFYTLNFLLPHRALLAFVLFNPPITSAPSAPAPQQPLTYHAAQDLARIGQLDPAQYNSSQEYNLWAYSTCSTAAMTEVINAYGHHYRVTDILKVEAQIGEITPQLGLLEDVGIQRTVAHFGFKTTWGHNLSLDQVITIANHGRPVIVSFPPARYAGGHLVVVVGGDSNYVLVADSSLWNRHAITRAQFLSWWEGFYAIVTPN